MIQIRKAGERGHFDHGWLNTFHTFSFGDYHDGRHMGFRSLRVINEDRVQPGQGFGTHGHRDMEIISYVLEGELAHKDSMGTGSVIVPGDVQYMSAGSGVRHSEFNASKTEVTHFYQIWIVPNAEGAPPRYDQKRFDDAARTGQLRLIASSDGADGSIAVRQDVKVYASILEPGGSLVADAPGGEAPLGAGAARLVRRQREDAVRGRRARGFGRDGVPILGRSRPGRVARVRPRLRRLGATGRAAAARGDSCRARWT